MQQGAVPQTKNVEMFVSHFCSQNVSFSRATNMFRNGFNANPMQRITMGEIMSVGLWHLQTLFGTYEQFLSVLWNVFLYSQCS